MHQVALEVPFVEPINLFAHFQSEPHAALIDCPRANEQLSRYAAIGFSPCFTIAAKNSVIRCSHPRGSETARARGDALSALEKHLARYRTERLVGIPPLQCGAIGYLGYDLGHALVGIPPHPNDDIGFDDMQVAFFDRVVTFDMVTKRAWAVGMAPEGAAATRHSDELAKTVEQIARKRRRSDVPGRKTLEPNFSRGQYETAVQRVLDYIFAGDIFQANLSQRFKVELGDLSPFELYCRLRERTFAPFSAYVAFGDTVIASASPERFVRLDGRRVETRPIKGTRPRGKTADEDASLRQALFNSEKDRAENLMIVDLMRNDLSRVCRPHSVKLTDLFAIESYATVHHLVSTVVGELNPDLGATDLLRATFPGGSITGAPKIRAMAILNELEPTARGPYCGILGYFGFDGSFDSSILIRTIAIKNSLATFQVGGGVVADSTPHDEYEETLVKAMALIDALGADDSKKLAGAAVE